jgi:serine/threonine protein phosphatase PrpC
VKFTIFQDSQLGDRSGNEDRVGYSYSRDVLMMVIADGMGGHEHGEVAAEIAVNEITRRFQQEARNKLRKPFEFLVSAVQSAHRAIVAHAVEQNLLECPRTTCVVCVIQNGYAYWAHAGDSRLYILRKGQKLAATSDHSKIQQMLEAGQITAEQAAKHPDRNKIFSCLGGVVPPHIDIGREAKLESGDTIMLMTDGFWAHIPAQILATMLQKQALTSVMPGLMKEAHRRANGEGDNLTVVAMTWEDQEDALVADTQSLDNEEFATSTNTTQMLGGSGDDVADVTDDDIERAIAEIQNAIKKVPR